MFEFKLSMEKCKMIMHFALLKKGKWKRQSIVSMELLIFVVKIQIQQNIVALLMNSKEITGKFKTSYKMKNLF